MASRLADRTVVVTGAASGQGLEVVRLFASEGARVAAVDIDSAGLDRLSATAIPGIRPFVCDVSDSEAISSCVSAIAEEFEGRVDVLYNNAGVSIRRAGPWDESQDGGIADITEDLFDTVIDINLKSQFLMCKNVIPYMVSAGRGSIVNVASVGGVLVGNGNNAYCVSKGGILGLTRAVAFTYGPHGIRTNLIAPGYIETPMIARHMENKEFVAQHESINPLRRIGKASEVATVGLFLASDDSSYVNGAVLPVDGGAHARTM
jgi:NAD(P)-dependent dehydrogenase (short-subunit alcohol dehydrogenase family)